MTEPTVTDLLARGRAREALSLYLAGATLDADIRAGLNTLVKIQEVLRDKTWSKALAYAEALREDASQLDGEALIDNEALVTELAQLKQAGEALERHKADEALALLEHVDLALLRAEAETLRGTAQIYHNDTAAAKTSFERALETDPKHYRAMTNLGNLALEAGDTNAAIKAYEAALRVNDDFANAHHNLGVAYRRQGNVTKSVRALKKAQGASQRQLRSEARDKLGETSPQVKRGFRWLLYAVVAVIAYFILRSQGII